MGEQSCFKKKLQLLLLEKLLNHLTQENCVAELASDGWQVNEWVKKAGNVLPIQNGNMGSRIFEYHDKMLLKKDYAEKEFVWFRASASYGSLFKWCHYDAQLCKHRAYVDAGMVDTLQLWVAVLK
jgi:2,3,4,5-tetrahydropyridine-2-carboxylate N-succinyltransferase